MTYLLRLTAEHVAVMEPESFETDGLFSHESENLQPVRSAAYAADYIASETARLRAGRASCERQA